MKIALLLIACAWFSSASAQPLIGPDKPVTLMTAIDTITTATGRLPVTVAARLTTNQIAVTVEIDGFGSPVSLDPKDVPSMLKVLEEASIKLKEGKDYSGKSGRLNAKVSAGKPQLEFDFGGDNLKLGPPSLIDAHNAIQMIRILARAKQVADWLAPKLPPLQPAPLPY